MRFVDIWDMSLECFVCWGRRLLSWYFVIQQAYYNNAAFLSNIWWVIMLADWVVTSSNDFMSTDFHVTKTRIAAGFNTTLRQGNITHHEYIQVRCSCLFHFSLYWEENKSSMLFDIPLHVGWKGKRCWVKPDCPFWRESGRRKWRASSKQGCVQAWATIWFLQNAIFLLHNCWVLCVHYGMSVSIISFIT